MHEDWGIMEHMTVCVKIACLFFFFDRYTVFQEIVQSLPVKLCMLEYLIM